MVRIRLHIVFTAIHVAFKMVDLPDQNISNAVAYYLDLVANYFG